MHVGARFRCVFRWHNDVPKTPREYNPLKHNQSRTIRLPDVLQSPSPVEAPEEASRLRPLCVDLDGTLVKSDTLVDTLLVLARNRPMDLLRFPRWLAHGKAAFKAAVTERVELDVAHLPLNRPLVEYLRAERASGRKLYLATGADGALAHRVAAHVGIFDEVLSSDGKTNLTGQNKLDAFVQRFDGSFDYIGNAVTDLPLLRAANSPMVANPTPALRARLRAAGIRPVHSFIDHRRFVFAFIKAIRVHQWAKNTLIFLPLLLAHAVHNRGLWLSAFLAFGAFSLAASSAYIVNDLLDLEADRRHHRKSRRPFAAADLSPVVGLIIVAVFLSIAGLIATRLPPEFAFWLCVYYGATLIYSLALKRVVLMDVLVLSGLYTLRILAGAAATKIPISPWLAAFSVFFFLSLAMAKRFAELTNLRAQDKAPANGRGYILADVEQLRSFGTSAAYGAVIIFILYLSNPTVSALYHYPQRMWMIAPLLIWWTSRVWLLASRGELDEDPLVFALTDRVSLGIGVLTFLVALFAV